MSLSVILNILVKKREFFMETSPNLTEQNELHQRWQCSGPGWGTIDDYWNNIDDWTDTSKIGTGVGAEYYDFAPNHKEMHQECLNFDDWFNAEKPLYEIYPMLSEKMSKLWPKEGLDHRGFNSPDESSEYYKDTPVLRWEENNKRFVREEKGWQRWFVAPFDRPKEFPIICKFLEDNKHKYHMPVISKLDAGGTIPPHKHKLKIRGDRVVGRYLFNMCINFPEECKFAIHPTGLIPYKAGEIYKLWVHEGMHSVINNTAEDRYHMILRPKGYKEYI